MHLEQTLAELARSYPPPMVAEQAADVPRIADILRLVMDRRGSRGVVMDVGGGLGLCSIGFAAAGWNVILVDDFQDENNRPFAEEVLRQHRSRGVRVISQDVIAQPLDLPAAYVDVITCIDSMEHWHHSPKRLFHRLMEILKPGGLFLLGVPNCVNLRKRLTVPFGKGKWSGMEYWYEPDVFRAHVREPDVDDLRYIARDLELQNIEILGRNWLGYGSGNPAIRAATKIVDGILQFRPALCSNIYLLGTKPSAAASR